MAERELAVKLTAKDYISKVVHGAKGEINDLAKTATKGVGTAVGNLEKLAVVAGGAVVAGVGYAVKAAGDFEAQMNTINTVAGLTPPALGKVADSIRAMSRESGISTEELTAGYYDLVSAGIKAADAQDVLNRSVTLGIGGLGTTGEAIDLLTTAVNAYGGDASQAGLFADYFAQAVAAGKVTVSEIASSFANAAPLAASLGIGVDELAASYAQMTMRGETGASSMTAVQAAMLALERTTPALDKLQKDLNVNFAEMAGEKGLAYTWGVIADAAAEAKIPLIDYTGRQEALAFVLDTSAGNAASYEEQLRLVRKAHDGEGVAAKQAAERQKGLNFQLNILKANVNDAAITIGSALIPKLVDLAGKATEWIQGHQPDIERFAQSLADGLASAVTWASKLDWEAIGNALKAGGAGAKMVLDAFLAMPPWVQAAVATGWGLNKLTGGAVGSIVGSLASGLIKGVLGMNAGVVNINAATVNGGVGGAGGAAGGSVLGTAAKWIIGPAAAVIIGSEIAAALNESTIKPAVDFEHAKLDAVVDSKDLARIVDGLGAIDDQLNTSDTSAQVALIASRIPFIGDALGHVAPDLEAQRQVLLDQLESMGLTRAQAIKLVDAQREATSRYGAAAVQQIAAVDRLHLPLGLGNVIAQQIRDKGAEQVAQAQYQSVTLGRWGGKLDTIAAKDFSLVANTYVNVQTQISAVQTLQQQGYVASSYSALNYSGKSIPVG